MNSATICGHCKRIEHCRMFLKEPHAVVSECGRYEETDLHKSIRESFTETMNDCEECFTTGNYEDQECELCPHRGECSGWEEE